MSKQNNLKDYLTDLYEGIAVKKPGASRNPQDFRSEIESITTEEPTPPLQIWFDEEAPQIGECNSKGAMTSDIENGVNDIGWSDWSLPIGNGYFGANVFGRVGCERIQITEKTLSNPWQNKDANYSQDGGLNNFSETYLDFKRDSTLTSEYKRFLDIEEAIAGVDFTYNGCKETRRYFTSYPDKVLVIYLESEDGNLAFDLKPTIPFIQEYVNVEGDGFSKTGTVIANDNTIELTGKMGYYDVDFMGIYKAFSNGQIYTPADQSYLSVNGTKALIVVTLGTDYRYTDGEGNYIIDGGQYSRQKITTQTDLNYTRSKVESEMNAVIELIQNHIDSNDITGAYELLKNRHVEDYQNLFKRVDLNLGATKEDLKIPTNELLTQVKLGRSSKYLETLLFQYGRYLLIASSRPGTLPANLQGAWNCYNTPPWSSGYWHNINVQMNYWPAFKTNLAETFEAYEEFNKEYMKNAEWYGENNVKNYYSENLNKDEGNGWTIGVSGNVYFESGSRSPGEAALTTQLFWDQYRYTQDESKFENIYKILSGAALYNTKVVKEDENGYLLVDYCDSPEQYVNDEWYYTSGTTYAQSLVYLNNKHTKELGERLGKTDSILNTINEQLDRYDPINIGASGQVKEFREEEYYGDLGDPSHRHISQLVGLYPGDLINPNTPAWIDAARISIQGRDGFNDPYGWSYAHKIGLYARTRDGEAARNEYHKLIKKAVAPNLWTKYKDTYQAEANFGITAGIAEMLVQTYETQDDRFGTVLYIDFLPALPNEWSNGSFSGLVAPGGRRVSCKWKDGKITHAEVEMTGRGGWVCVGSTLNEDVGQPRVWNATEEAAYLWTHNPTNEKITNFKYTRDGLSDFMFTWDDPYNGECTYSIDVAVENNSHYKQIYAHNRNSFAYNPPVEETNKRMTFKITNWGNGAYAICHYNPIETELKVTDANWRITSQRVFEVSVDTNMGADSYYLYEKIKGTAGYHLVNVSDTHVLSYLNYNLENEYAVSAALNKIESELFIIQKAHDVLYNYQFNPTVEAASVVQPGWNNSTFFGYENLTNSNFDSNSGRFSTSSATNALVDATVGFNSPYTLSELRMYDYSADYQYAGNDLLIEGLDADTGNWVELASVTENAEFINYRSNADETGYKYLSFNLNNAKVNKLRIYISSPVSGKSISFYEIRAFGYTSEPETVEILRGKEFIPTEKAKSAVYSESFNYSKLTDGLYQVAEKYRIGRFSTKVNNGTNSSLVDATVDLGGNYKLHNLVVKPYADSSNPTGQAYLGVDLIVEVLNNNSEWEVAYSKTNADFASDMSERVLIIPMNDVVGSQIRIYSSAAVSGKSTSYFEIEGYGYPIE